VGDHRRLGALLFKKLLLRIEFYGGNRTD